MKRILALLPISLFIFLPGCGSDPLEGFHVEKKFWDTKDYEDVIARIKYKTPKGEKYPCYANPEKAMVFKKLVDINNFTVVMDDKTLGVNHRDEFGQKMFGFMQDLEDVYSGLDNQDKFIYPMEFVDILRFGLELQVRYFKLGNENVLKESDNPNSDEVKQIVNHNIQTLVNNYTIYLDFVNREKAFSPDALKKYADGIPAYFKPLTDEFPGASYADMQSKAELMLKKAESPELKSALQGLIDILDKKNHPEPLPSDTVKTVK